MAPLRRRKDVIAHHDFRYRVHQTCHSGDQHLLECWILDHVPSQEDGGEFGNLGFVTIILRKLTDTSSQ